MLKKIAITGPESSGKSTLAAGLSKHFFTAWVPEFARLWLEAGDGNYGASDLRTMAQGQLAFEHQKLSGAQQYLFCDTDMLVYKIWHQDVFKTIDPVLEELWTNSTYDFWLLCRPDIPWEPDPLRENQFDRDRLFDLYETELKTANKPYAIIEGDSAALRLQLAIWVLEK